MLILSTFALVNHGSSGDLLALVGTFLFVQPASNLPSVRGVSGARPATLGQVRAWSKTGLQLSISAALPSHPHLPGLASWLLWLLLGPCEIPTVPDSSAHYTKAYWIPDAARGRLSNSIMVRGLSPFFLPLFLSLPLSFSFLDQKLEDRHRGPQKTLRLRVPFVAPAPANETRIFSSRTRVCSI